MTINELYEWGKTHGALNLPLYLDDEEAGIESASLEYSDEYEVDGEWYYSRYVKLRLIK